VVVVGLIEKGVGEVAEGRKRRERGGVMKRKEGEEIVIQ